tara:strand:- start:88471 stop:88740 length:270 start_codon:yes stop_codon:yes gene_type:complete
MVLVKRIVLDVLKPHQPNALEFSQAIARVGSNCQVHLTVLEMDENTETVEVVITGNSINFDDILLAISNMGGSLHSIDEVEVQSETNDD